MRRPILPLLGLLLFSAITPAEDTGKLNIGQAIKETDARQHGVSILPNGKGLPDGRGTAKQGAAIYAAKCSACHGERGEGHEDFPVLVGGRGSLATDNPILTVGSYWPTATTIYDYVWRAMPYTAPGSLTADETYALTAWLLSANDVVGPSMVIDRRSLPKVRMPNANGFIRDPDSK